MSTSSLPPSNSADRLTVVVTAYNSEQTIAKFLSQLVTVISASSLITLHQLVVVDDCSTDDTFNVVTALADTIPALRVIKLSRNRGQQLAVSAGVSVSTGELTLVIDDDGQNPISEIPNLIKRSIETSADVIIATSQHRKFGRRISSRLFWSVMRGSRLEGEPDSQLMMRVLSRRVVDAFNSYPESTRTVYGIVRDIGFRTEGYEVQVQPHIAGREASRYSFLDRLEVFIDTYLTSANRPFAFLVTFSLGALVLGAGLLLGAAISSLYVWSNSSFLLLTSGLVSILLAGAIFGLSIVIRLLVLIYVEARRRPLFHVAEDTDLWQQRTGGHS
jgi:dolichol-phosphate mannosyltransferase